MRISDAHLILPLHLAEGAFLEVLLSRFELSRKAKGRGVELEVEFGDDTPATWNRRGREAVRKRMPKFDRRSARYQAELDRILLNQESGAFRHENPRFPFRWASAGALPVLNIAKKEYYCLFYRDVFPIGWNIANGATDDSAELLDPLLTLERELGEELVIVDKKSKKRYVLRPDRDTLLDRPEFAVFRSLWREQFPGLDLAKFQTAQLPLRWEEGPDRVKVRMGSRTRDLADCFVNINAADFGIELDKIARITVNERLVLCDGEVTGRRALNRPVGLFEVSRVQQEIKGGMTTFTPEVFYHGGERYPGIQILAHLKSTLLPEMETWRSKRDVACFKRTPDARRLSLCPVTSSIIRRHMQSTRRERNAPEPAHKYDVFVSHAAPDEALARRVFDAIKMRNPHVFFAPTNLKAGTWNAAIDSALESARIFVGVASKPEYFERPWPKFELNAFHMAHLAETNARIIPFVDGIDPNCLPLPLRSHQVIDCSGLGFGKAVERLMKLIP